MLSVEVIPELNAIHSTEYYVELLPPIWIAVALDGYGPARPPPIKLYYSPAASSAAFYCTGFELRECVS
jgi:hypothetical protein